MGFIGLFASAAKGTGKIS
jgi:F0F1-type ATP synthase beta subunit